MLTTPRPASVEAEPKGQSPICRPRFDIVESENELVLYGDMPGVEDNNLDIRYENEPLTNHGKAPARKETAAMLRQEYGVGDYQRTFLIGESIDAEKITAEIHNGVLVVQAERKSESSTDPGNTSSYGKVYRSMIVPNGIEAGEIQATYKNGVLEVHLPKGEHAKAKRIAVH
ncbi:Hsp20 family protein [Novipirellula artificiosorum]|uniref:18 kDa heat shock protein n=1 Tax=Novipirellula artificiosorum TaxID=2528016 RepID=A0A5C6DP10_9BACT|nr:Hsp20 family protein [Novipirellula artificiosorum]TWU38342.1 18 kDa heat shock protein [Novipirellula artificiosorum]